MSDPTLRTVELTVDSAIKREALLDASEASRTSEDQGERAAYLRGDYGEDDRMEIATKEDARDEVQRRLTAGATMIAMDLPGEVAEGIRLGLVDMIQEACPEYSDDEPSEQVREIERAAELLPMLAVLAAVSRPYVAVAA